MEMWDVSLKFSKVTPVSVTIFIRAKYESMMYGRAREQYQVCVW
jgi:hypothetical protein